MAFADNVLSTEVLVAPFTGGRSLTLTKILDYETGGIALNDPTQGHLVQIWETNIVDGTTITVEAEGIAPVTVYTGIDITEVSLTFDQNMRPTFSFVEGGAGKLNWYDSAAQNFVVTDFGSDYLSPRVSLDDKRDTQMGTNDVIFAYIKNNNLYFRMQRDRYEVEYLLATDVITSTSIAYLRRIGMNEGNRFQFEIFTPWSEEQIIADMLTRTSDPATQGTFADTTTVATRLDTGSTTIYSQDNDTSEE